MSEELTSVDVETYSRSRLAASDPEVVRMLEAALVVARRRAGWHVSPVIEDDELVLDGPDSRILWLPTRRVENVTAITENDKVIAPTAVRWSGGGAGGAGNNRPVAMKKKSGGFWTPHYQSIEITMTHGFTKAQAGDWRQAVMSMVDQMSLVPVVSGSGTSEIGLRTKTVDDVTYRWDSYIGMAEDALLSVDGIISGYALPSMEFI